MHRIGLTSLHDANNIHSGSLLQIIMIIAFKFETSRSIVDGNQQQQSLSYMTRLY